MKVFIYLFVISCNSYKIVIREGVEGYIFDKQTNKPIDSVSLGFYINPSDSTNSNIENEFFSNKKGFFKIQPVIKNVKNPQELRRFENRNENYLKVRKNNYTEKRIYIRDAIYKRDKEKHMVYVDTIFLKPIK